MRELVAHAKLLGTHVRGWAKYDFSPREELAAGHVRSILAMGLDDRSVASRESSLEDPGKPSRYLAPLLSRTRDGAFYAIDAKTGGCIAPWHPNASYARRVGLMAATLQSWEIRRETIRSTGVACGAAPACAVRSRSLSPARSPAIAPD